MKKNNFCTVYLVRHGQTDWNVKNLVQGHTDRALNSEGIIQAKEIATELKRVKFDKAFSSDLLRAKQTAEIIAKEHKLAVETTEILRERNFGYLEGESNEKLKNIQKEIAALEESRRFSYKHHPSVENDEEVITRLMIFIRETAISYIGKNILVVSHGGPIRILLIKLGVASHADIINVTNLAYVKLESDGSDFFVKEIKGIKVNGKELKNF
ncbi:MAG: histidine phosphatase family protein [Patescibacteria group bacterium]|nr:histidine phosphatase family protein [Patescibacteria group bacterium]